MSSRPATFDHIAGRIPASAFAGDPSPVRALVIACVDGCMPTGGLEAHLRMDGLVVTRNPANLVPSGNGDWLAETVEQVLVRGARELIVCGHIGCGMIARLLDPRTALDDLALATWLDHADAVRQAVLGVAPGEQLAHAVEVNVTQQLAHLRTYSAVVAALLGGRVHLRGWLYDPARDEMLTSDALTGRFTRRAALDPAQNSLFLKERLRAGPSLPLPLRDARSRYLA